MIDLVKIKMPAFGEKQAMLTIMTQITIPARFYEGVILLLELLLTLKLYFMV